MIRTTEQELRARAERIAARLEGIPAQIRASHSAIGGGSTPDQELPTWVIELDGGDAVGLEQRLRSASTPVIARIERDRVLLDLRTIRTEDEEALIASVRSAY
jgi:L-seryl-tRNA(Ser) seleniumtransferase